MIGEICCDRLLVVLNKIDLLKAPDELEKVKTKLTKALLGTKFKCECAPLLQFWMHPEYESCHYTLPPILPVESLHSPFR